MANLAGGFIVGFLENNGLQFMATLVLTGAIVGTMQWFVLRNWGRFRGWPLASSIGWIISTVLNRLINSLTEPLANFLWHQAGLWEVFWINLINQPLWILGMAIAQSVFLARRGAVGLWILASLIGAAANGAVSASLCAVWCQELPTALVGIVNGLGWATYGVVTGLAAIKLWVNPPREAG